MSIVEDLIEQASISEGKDGYKATRMFRVAELSGDANQRLYEALQHPDLPVRGNPHPVIPGIQVLDRRGDPHGGHKSALVAIEYGRPTANQKPPKENDPVEWSIESTLQEVETTRDFEGNEIVLNHTFQNVDGNGDPSPVEAPPQVGLLNIQIPLLVIRGSRTESQNPADKARIFTGKINSQSYFGEPARTWLCSRIGGTTDDGGETFRVEYEFIRNEYTWDPEIAYFDKEKNEHPTDLEEGVGIKRVPIYEAVDFDSLNLNSPF